MSGENYRDEDNYDGLTPTQQAQLNALSYNLRQKYPHGLGGLPPINQRGQTYYIDSLAPGGASGIEGFQNALNMAEFLGLVPTLAKGDTVYFKRGNAGGGPTDDRIYDMANFGINGLPLAGLIDVHFKGEPVFNNGWRLASYREANRGLHFINSNPGALSVLDVAGARDVAFSDISLHGTLAGNVAPDGITTTARD